MSGSLGRSGEGHWAPRVLAVVYVLLLFAPWRFAFPTARLDGSWIEVITLAARDHWEWGRDIVFTYGPLGYLVPNRYVQGSLGLSLALNAFLAISLGCGIVALLPRSSTWSAFGLFVLMVFAAGMKWRWACSALSLLAAMLYFRKPENPRPLAALLLAAGAGVFAMAYLSAGPLGVVIFLLLDASRLAQRRVPVFIPVFLSAAALSYLVAGQHVDGLSTFLRASFEIITGYASAMSIAGPREELAAFLVASAIAIAMVLRVEWSGLGDARRRRDSLLLIAVLGTFWLVTLKTGFVRHDAHSVSAWTELATAAAAYAAMRWETLGAHWVRWGLPALSLAACTAAIIVQEGGAAITDMAQLPYRILVLRPAGAFQEALTALRHTDAWRASMRKEVAAAYARIRETAPLPNVEGSVDVISNDQASLIAQGLQYRPRPVFQDYAAYTAWLIALNRAHYRSPAAAQHLLLRPETIDDRYPFLDQGAAAIELLTYYDPVRIEDNLLLLERRAAPLQITSIESLPMTVALGQWVLLDTGQAPTMLRADISANLLGRLIGVALRPPTLRLTVRLADGNEHEYRLIAGMARSGFLLSPVVPSALDFAAVATNSLEAVSSRQVIAFKIDAGSELGRRFYHQPVGITYTSLRLDVEATQRGESQLRELFKRYALVNRMVASSERRFPFVEARGTELFAHAPTSIALPVTSASRLRVNFGLHRGAWTDGGATAGVCFRIAAVANGSAPRILLDRCLDPVARPEDRPEQAVDITVGLAKAGTLSVRDDLPYELRVGLVVLEGS